jgi:hypothetical protein
LKLHLVPPKVDLEFLLDLPWDLPLAQWRDPRIVQVAGLGVYGENAG